MTDEVEFSSEKQKKADYNERHVDVKLLSVPAF